MFPAAQYICDIWSRTNRYTINGVDVYIIPIPDPMGQGAAPNGLPNGNLPVNLFLNPLYAYGTLPRDFSLGFTLRVCPSPADLYHLDSDSVPFFPTSPSMGVIYVCWVWKAASAIIQTYLCGWCSAPDATEILGLSELPPPPIPWSSHYTHHSLGARVGLPSQ